MSGVAAGEGFLPCPFCGGADVCGEILATGMCKTCGSLGPATDSASHWNARAPALTWTSEPPAVPGWYWARHPFVLEFVMVWVGPEDIGRAKFKPGSQWAGPIPEPEEGAS